MTEERRLWSYGPVIIIGHIIIIPLVLIGSALICILNVYAGIFMVSMVSILFFLMLWQCPYRVVFNSSAIIEKNGFGKIRKTLYWADLKKIVVKYLSARKFAENYYFVFIFTDEDLDFKSYDEAIEEDRVITMSYRKGLKEIIKEYTAIEIDDHLIKR